MTCPTAAYQTVFTLIPTPRPSTRCASGKSAARGESPDENNPPPDLFRRKRHLLSPQLSSLTPSLTPIGDHPPRSTYRTRRSSHVARERQASSITAMLPKGAYAARCDPFKPSSRFPTHLSLPLLTLAAFPSSALVADPLQVKDRSPSLGLSLGRTVPHPHTGTHQTSHQSAR